MADVLIVDDDGNNRLLLATLVRHAGHTALEACDARTALAIVEQQRPALTIVDLALPDISGAELVRRMRANPRTGNMKIALYTATPPGAALDELSDAYRINAVIPKPGDPRETLRVLEQLLAPQSD